MESGIFYFASPILGEKILRKSFFGKFVPKKIKSAVNEQIPKSLKEIKDNKTLPEEIKKRAIALKGGILLACTAIPTAEYTLSFAKNLFTLKVFKKGNFNNIANLDKNGNEVENKHQQERIKKNSIKQIKTGAYISGLGVVGGTLLAVKGHKSDVLQKISKTVINPGEAIANGLKYAGMKNKTLTDTISKFSLDFGNNNGKLSLGKGQLALTAIVGLFGYSKAAEDRGKLDVKEVWTRVPLVVLYTIFGSELFQMGFEKILKKKNVFSDLLKETEDGRLTTPKRAQLPFLAEKLAIQNGTNKLDELSRLTKQKAFVEGVPYAFSLLFMGFTLAAITRFWTQYRYNHQNTNNDFSTIDKPNIFKEFENYID